MPWRPGPFALLAVGAAALLAHGVPGVAGGAPPARTWMDDHAAEVVREDASVHLEFGDPDNEHSMPQAQEGGERSGVPFRRDYRKVAHRAAVRAGIGRPELFVRQMAAESGYQPCARSSAGAIGIAQIMPTTARAWNVDPHIPEDALRVAAEHMARYERQYGSYRLALAAYNAGPGAVRDHGGVPPYPETQAYIDRITDPTYPLAGMRQVYHLPARLQSGFARRLHDLQRDVHRHGGRLRVTEGWRSYEDQAREWHRAKQLHGGWQNARAWAAAPGCSNHGRGYAADLRGSLGLAHRLAGRHGLVFPMAHEPWHVEMTGIATQSG